MRNRLRLDWDWPLALSAAALAVIGIIAIGSATHIDTVGWAGSDYVIRQSVFFLINACIVIWLQRFDYRRLKELSVPIYILTVLILVAVMFLGTSALGAQRWIQIGPVTVQPSEFSKLLMIVSTAAMMAQRTGKLKTFRSLLPILLFVGVPAFLVFRQPDLGTSLVYVAITIGMVFVAGIRIGLVRNIAVGAIALLPAVWFFLHDYQKRRITVFLNPDEDPFGAGYHIIQSKISIGSGAVTGKGIFAGTQSRLNFLPENHTDFIFSVIGEETGFIGCIVVLLLFFVLMYRTILIARNANDDFSMLLATGIGTMLCFQVLVNIGMTTGIMPVTGIPLPFISYGVSSLTTNMMAVGLLLNISLQRKKRMF